MIIGCDIDGVVADYMGTFLKYFNIKYKRSITKENLNKWAFWEQEELYVTKDQFLSAMDDFNEYRMWQSIEPHECAREALCSLDSGMNCIFYITTRPLGSERATLKFILRNGLPIRGIYFCSEDNEKVSVAKQINASVVIDDKVSIINKYIESGIPCIAIENECNKEEIRDLKETETLRICYGIKGVPNIIAQMEERNILDV